MQRKCSTVIVEGIPGVGKTTASLELARALGPTTLYVTEPDEKHDANPYLQDYYQDPKAWAFTMQVHLLQARYRAHQRIMWHAAEGVGHSVMDRSFYGDVCFAHLQRKLGFITAREFNTYRDLFHAMSAAIHYPALCVFLATSPDVALERINVRMKVETGRTCETAITLDYLERLDQAVQHMIGCLREHGTRVIEVPWNKDRDTTEQRAPEIAGIVDVINSHRPHREFADIFDRVT